MPPGGSDVDPEDLPYLLPRHLQWTGDRPLLGAIINLVAHALATTDPETAAKLQGAARTLVISAAVSNGIVDEGTPTNERAVVRPAANQNDFVTQLRHTTAAALRDALGDTRMRELRAEGERLDRDEAVAYALGAISDTNTD
jgi:hypothetical protein